MFYIYYGDDRQRIFAEVKRVLGEDYEIFEGEKLSAQDIMNICQGVTLFAAERKILIRDLTPARKDEADMTGVDRYAEFAKYINSPHTIVIWETNTSRKKSFLEFKKMQGVKVMKFEAARSVEAGKIFEVVDMAFVDGKRAVKMLSEIKDENDPYMFVGLLASKLCERYKYSRGEKDKQALLELAELDMLTKTSAMDPWRLVEGFLIRLSSL